MVESWVQNGGTRIWTWRPSLGYSWLKSAKNAHFTHLLGGTPFCRAVTHVPEIIYQYITFGQIWEQDFNVAEGSWNIFAWKLLMMIRNKVIIPFNTAPPNPAVFSHWQILHCGCFHRFLFLYIYIWRQQNKLENKTLHIGIIWRFNADTVSSTTFFFTHRGMKLCRYGAIKVEY